MVRRVLSAFLLSTPLIASAHSPYLLPNAFALSDRDHVTVQASLTEEFFVPDVVMKSDDFHVVNPDGSRVAVAPVYTKDVAILEVATPTSGTYRISSGTRAGRTSRMVLVDGDWKSLRGTDAAPAGAKVYEVKSFTNAEVFVTRGEPSTTVLAPRKTGMEFRPLTHPGKLVPGGAAQFEVLFNGQPLRNHPVKVHTQDERYAGKAKDTEVRTDAAGHFTVKLAHAGTYLATTRHRTVTDDEKSLAESHTYSLTFEVVDRRT
jgi:uncharacterized GH25 family protein